MDPLQKDRPLLLFDGECNLCHFAVSFMLKYEKNEQLLFVPLQSKLGKELLHTYRIPKAVDSVIVIMDEKAYTYADAVFQLLLFLPFYWRPLRLLRLFPSTWRHSMYRVIAHQRYVLFGKRQSCRILTTRERKRFLL